MISAIQAHLRSVEKIPKDWLKNKAKSEIPNSKMLRKSKQIGSLNSFCYVQIMEIICGTFICNGVSAKHPPENQPVLRRV